ncbi:DUF3833 family protein [Vibrio lentus]|nr:DUF3833 family protein [Vibrio lentus]
MSLVFGLTGCGSASLENHADTTPELKLETFFDGELIGLRHRADRSGNLPRCFDAKLIATWDGDNGEIKEWFSLLMASVQPGVWNSSKPVTTPYTGTANDVVGSAYGETRRSALYWKYDLEIEVDGSTYEVVLDDWMFLMDDKRLF